MCVCWKAPSSGQQEVCCEATTAGKRIYYKLDFSSLLFFQSFNGLKRFFGDYSKLNGSLNNKMDHFVIFTKVEQQYCARLLFMSHGYSLLSRHM